MRPIGVPSRRRSRTSKEMCHPAAPIETNRRSMLVHSVSRVPSRNSSSSHRISPYSSTLGASTRVTFVSIGAGAPSQASFTVAAVARFASTSNGAHSRRCAGSVSACQTFSGEWRNSLTRTSAHFSPVFSTRAMLAGPGVYGARLVILSSLPRIVCKLRDLNEVAARVIQHRNGRAGHVGRRHREFGAVAFDSLVVALDIVREKHSRGLTLLKQRLLIRTGGRAVVQRQL